VRKGSISNKSLCLQALERAKGIEPSTENSQEAQNQSATEAAQYDYTQIRAQIPDSSCPDLAKVVAAWLSLSQPLKAAILAIVAVSKNEVPK